MSPCDGGVDRHRPVDHPGRISRGQQPGEHAIPGAVSAHPPMPGPDALPRAEHLGHVPPGDPTAIPINDAFDHRTSITKRPTPLTRSNRKQIGNQIPLGIGQQLKPRHALSLRHHTRNNCQTRPSANMSLCANSAVDLAHKLRLGRQWRLTHRLRHRDLDVLHDRLVALRAEIADGTEHIHLGHVAGRVAARDAVRHCLVAAQ